MFNPVKVVEQRGFNYFIERWWIQQWKTMDQFRWSWRELGTVYAETMQYLFFLCYLTSSLWNNLFLKITDFCEFLLSSEGVNVVDNFELQQLHFHPNILERTDFFSGFDFYVWMVEWGIPSTDWSKISRF